MELVTKNKVFNKLRQKIELNGTWLRKDEFGYAKTESGKVQAQNFQQVLKELTVTEKNNGSECRKNELGVHVRKWETWINSVRCQPWHRDASYTK